MLWLSFTPHGLSARYLPSLFRVLYRLTWANSYVDFFAIHVCRCGHCKHLTPEYKTLGETVAKDPKLKDSVVIAKVNQRCR